MRTLGPGQWNGPTSFPQSLGVSISKTMPGVVHLRSDINDTRHATLNSARILCCPLTLLHSVTVKRTPRQARNLRWDLIPEYSLQDERQ